jgi:hypothetical protein
MAKTLRMIARALAAIVLGYGLIVLLTIAGFNVWLGGANLFRGGLLLMAKGMLVALVAGLAGGYVAGLIGGARPMLHASLVLIPLLADSIYVFFFFPRETPLWFEIIGSAGLMLSTLAGGALRAWQNRSARILLSQMAPGGIQH